ncbi:RNA polymerase-associated protein CTR9 [Wickerhamomyces ciferrii]|uniref:RNA polymerase-associated protein CTR9 n=1 Tax=Wickerhamomyces ciferrii (strain ATCC 14091 / BCRC 22168 / CBS 111 / JCM 3599 / NBRC 0793 / NRRL Y-1031 F-60-10) TaxID=1206466 RepID=K0KK37_WICCF|nr:RNA polymerase-associated protein CTR9 [Wickerhamomyces ciferrii]CCH43266.1 RNA polymerase-associated protein CTR9 [Wickerhamomyces ciferrii]
MSKVEKVDENVLGASFYLKGEQANSTVEVPMNDSNEVVTIDLEEELPEDPTDLCTLLENEHAAPHYWLLIAAVYANKSLVNEAMEVITTGLNLYQNSESAPFHTFLSWLNLRQSKSSIESSEDNQFLKKAADSLKIALQYQPHYILNRLARAEITYQQGQYDQALDYFERILKLDVKSDSNVYALLGKAKTLYNKKNYQTSLKTFQQILILNPLLKPDPRIGIGLNFWNLKDKKMATKAWERSLEIDPENEVAKLLIVLSKFDSSFDSLTDDDFISTYTKALESLQTLIKTTPENPVLLLLLASYYYSKNDLDSVLKICEKVLQKGNLSSNLSSDANFWIARVHFEREDFSNSTKFFAESLKLNSDNLLAKLGVGQSQIQRGSIEDSIITFESIYNNNQKILEIDYILGILYAQDEKNHQKAIAALEKYIRLSKDKNEPIALNTYLTLSKLFENKDNSLALSHLSKALDVLKKRGETIPIEVLNNLGVFHFIKGNPESANTFFESAHQANTDEDLNISLTYNLARTQENSDIQSSIDKYNEISEKSPSYIYSKIRLLFLEILQADVKNDQVLEEKLNQLLESHVSNLEVRAFYSWYLKRSNKANTGKGENLESKHNKETLVKYDSHDTYALISLGNLYCSIAREVKGKTPQDLEKKNQSYVRGAQLFQKVLTIDPNNVFAAQGIAIIFVENKHSTVALETFRKIRDAIDDVSVYINLGHCLIEVGQFSKAIESYEIALRRYGDETKDSRYLTLVGRAWFARASAEKSLESYLKSLEYSEKAFEVAENTKLKKILPSLKYNIAFVQFNIAQFIQRQDISKRTVEDISKALDGLKIAIDTLNELANEKYPPYPADILKQRASMGSNTLINQLERAIKEQKDYETKFEDKLKAAQEAREKERLKAELEEEKRKEEEAAKQELLKAEYLKLQEQAKEWEREREAFIEPEDDEDTGKKSKKGKKSKNAINTDDELSDEDKPVKKSRKSSGKKSKRKKDENAINGDDEEESPEAKKRKLSSKKYKSADIIEDSDEDLEDFDESKLGDDNEDDDALEKAEAKIDAQGDEKEGDDQEEQEDKKVENGEEKQDDDDDEDGLF